MKKAAFFATIVLFMGVMGYLIPKQSKAIIDDNKSPVVGPFSLVVGDQAAEVRLVKAAARMGQPPDPDRPCMFEVIFFDDMGMAVGDPTGLRLMDNHIMSAMLDPSDPSLMGRYTGREHFVAQVMIVGDPKACIGTFITAAVFDMTTGGTMSDTVPITVFGLPLI